MQSDNSETICEIAFPTAKDFLLPKHYSGRIPSISKAFGLFENGELKAVITFGKPASDSLCRGICGIEYSKNVYELNRLCRTDDYKKPLSHFVSYCLKQLKPLNWIIVSYSDTAMNHHGYIYQACNFLYTGQTKARTDKYVPDGKHSRHYDKTAIEIYRKVRSAKHRYIYICGDKSFKSKVLLSLNYPILEYPKGDNNMDYKLGFVLQDQIIKVKEE